MLKQESDEMRQMMQLAQLAMQNAYAPYSRFHVGCSIKTRSGEVFSGANVECAAFGSTQCAEASALGAMVTAGEREIESVVVMAPEGVFCPPCGNCRQMLSELADGEVLIHLCSPHQIHDSIPLAKLLPFQFRLEKKS